MTLRARLTLALVALAAAGLAIAGVATYRALAGFLIDQVDDQLRSEVAQIVRRVDTGPGDARFMPLRYGAYTELRDASDDSRVRTYFDDAPTVPDLPDEIPGTYFTVRGEDGSSRFRVIAQPLGGGRTRLLAVPLDDVDDTLRRLLVVEVIVAATVLGVLSVVAWWAVKVGLRPLEHMEETAGAIAAGDLSRRVDDVDDRTEAGRLGLAFNTMLTRIEDAFAQREASEARLRRFVADASHELRTPLTSIRGYAELFRRGADANPDDLEKAMRRIEEEARRMGVLVDDLLLLARLDQGRPLERAPVDLVALARDAVADARAAHPGRDVALGEVPPSAVVTGDEARLRQVLANLLTNACTHTPEGTAVRVTVEAGPGEVVVAVTDDGPGLRAEEAAHVFERFWRADTSRARASGGTGLGLSIVAAIARAHGGTAEVDSAPGAGATFRVRLPTVPPGPA
ncbi:MAG: putative sensor histidine kinase PhoR [Acidimicrobiia bacterium]|nr:MAG: putative sensor histidine kinase PhoR [Acidimicrobiia bacterium]